MSQTSSLGRHSALGGAAFMKFCTLTRSAIGKSEYGHSIKQN